GLYGRGPAVDGPRSAETAPAGVRLGALRSRGAPAFGSDHARAADHHGTAGRHARRVSPHTGLRAVAAGLGAGLSLPGAARCVAHPRPAGMDHDIRPAQPRHDILPWLAQRSDPWDAE